MLKYFKLTKQQKQFVKLLKKKNAFDKNFYCFRTYNTGKKSISLANYLFPIRHYVLKGQYTARTPFEDFDTSHYIDYLYLSDPKDKKPAYQCYLENQHIKKKDISKKEGLYYEALKKIDLIYKSLDFSPIKKPSDIAAVIHLYHLDMLDGLLDYTKRIPRHHDLIITINHKATDKQRTHIEKTLLSLYSKEQIKILYVPNHGRDIFPFLNLINNHMLDPYKTIFKIHSKKKLYNLTHGAGELYNLSHYILPPALPWPNLEQLIDNEKISLIISKGHIFGSQFWTKNKSQTLFLLDQLGIKFNPDQLRFPAGSIYWIKPFLIQKLKELNLTAFDFNIESGFYDGRMEHAVERAIGCISIYYGLEQYEIDKDNKILKEE